jgi:hypothetical protein
VDIGRVGCCAGGGIAGGVGLSEGKESGIAFFHLKKC